MTMGLEELLREVQRSGRGVLTADEAEGLLEATRKYPYFALPARLLLRHAPAGFLSDEIRDELRARVALSGERAATEVNASSADTDVFNSFYPPKASARPETTDTDSVITTFLETYGTTSPEEEAMLERLIFNPTPDYAEMLAREEQQNLPSGDATPGSQDSLIDAFILSQHPAARPSSPEPAPATESPEPPAPVAAPEDRDQALLSESLAKIFIKQGRYQRAYEIIYHLSLNFPKKSVYFADQLRFLQKLIINQRHQDALKEDV